MSSVVAIVGRPNVGKSTLMNRIIGRREAIVEERPGVTRDRKEVEASWLGRSFTLIDTGGWITGGDALHEKVSRQSEQAMSEAYVILFVLDSTVGITEEDAQVASLLRKRAESVVVVANKVDDRNHESAAWELVSLGLGDPSTISALHGRGTGDLLDRVIELLPEIEEAEETTEETSEKIVAVALVGRPNVGKSTLFNHLIGEERAVVHDRPGTTRDAIDTIIESQYGPIRFIDTAGMRRKARIDEDTEYYSLIRALEAINKADIALLVVDSTVGVTHQDQRLSERIDAAGCPIVVVLNKWELLGTDERELLVEQVEMKLGFLADPPLMKISALSGKGIHRLFPILGETIHGYHRRIPTREVNLAISKAQIAHPAPAGGRVLYATQGSIDPPTFTFFVNKKLPRTYIRYLENQLRSQLDLGSTPIKIRVRNRNT